MTQILTSLREQERAHRERLEWNQHVINTLWVPIVAALPPQPIIVRPDGTVDVAPCPEMPEWIRDLLR